MENPPEILNYQNCMKEETTRGNWKILSWQFHGQSFKILNYNSDAM